MSQLRIEVCEGPAPPAAVALRLRVFVDEQGVDEAEEIDGLDPRCVHFVAWRGDEAVGCARLRPLGPGHAKIERVALRRELRGLGLGRELMGAVEREAARRGLRDLLLHAQTPVVDFYAKLGWLVFGDEFDEAGIPHLAMQRRLL